MRLKPAHLFSPRTLLGRLRLAVRPLRGTEHRHRLIWGDVLELNPQEIIGGDIVRQGIFDLAVSELAWRLLQPGDAVLDAGANIGYFSLLFSQRVGPAGRVHAFEPHPRLSEALRRNVAAAKARRGAQIEVHQVALSSARGRGLLAHSPYFEENQGISQLCPPGQQAVESGMISHPVELETLDHLFPEGEFALLKIDVEGHEEPVLQGAARLLRERRVQHVVFEAEQHGRSPGAALLQEAGYTLFLPGHSFWGPRLDAPEGRAAVDEAWETPSCLATLDPDGLRRLMAPRGWRVLRG